MDGSAFATTPRRVGLHEGISSDLSLAQRSASVKIFTRMFQIMQPELPPLGSCEEADVSSRASVTSAGVPGYDEGPSWVRMKASPGKEFLKFNPDICRGFEMGFGWLTYPAKFLKLKNHPL